LAKNNTAVTYHPSYFFLFPQLKIKLRGCHFNTLDVTEAESQAALNTLTEHDFQDVFKNGRSAWNSIYTWKGTPSRVMWASKPKVSF
jgi:hypothetical protein